MNLLASIVGYLLLGATALGCCYLAVYGIVTQLSALIDKRADDAAKLRQQEIGNRLGSDAWWFSEDERTFRLLSQIGMDIQKSGWCDVDKLREEWRRKSASVNQN